MIDFIICLLITVIVHELAHMIVALKCGIGVKVFSIGFGKPYLHKTIRGIDYRLSPLPFGGYCDLKRMDSKKDKDDFLMHPYRHKFIVLVAGCVTNILLAFGIYLWQFGSISFGLEIDWIFIKTMFTKDYTAIYFILKYIPLNLFLLQLSLLNLFCGIVNLLPIPALDGGHLWMVLMEKVWKKNFVFLYNLITWLFFYLLIIGQFWLVWILYADEIKYELNNLLLNLI